MIHVVAGAVTRADGWVLIAQRPPGKHLAGGWEFPGGKLEPGEGRADGLKRELAEELGIAIDAPRPLLRVHHAYDYGEVLIDMWVVRRYRGEPRGMDGQALRWCAPHSLEAADLLPADRPIVRALRLPERLVQASTADYRVRRECGAEPTPAAGPLLSGRVCDVTDATRQARTADFLVLQRAIPDATLQALCNSVPVPVYARAPSLEGAWRLGATGLNELELP